MSAPDQTFVRDTLLPFREILSVAVRSAWSDWQSSGLSGRWFAKRSRANYVWEQIIFHARTALVYAENVRIFEGNETVQFLVDDLVLFRFKKADEKGKSSNVATQLALAFHDHDTDLFGFPEVQRVEVVYKLNRLETEIEDVCVVARDGEDVIWGFSLLDLDEGATVLPLPILPIAPEQPAAALVKLKGATEATKERKD